jgi:hypothetical protein
VPPFRRWYKQSQKDQQLSAAEALTSIGGSRRGPGLVVGLEEGEDEDPTTSQITEGIPGQFEYNQEGSDFG